MDLLFTVNFWDVGRPMGVWIQMLCGFLLACGCGYMCWESGFEINEHYFMLCRMDSPKGKWRWIPCGLCCFVEGGWLDERVKADVKRIIP